MGIAILTEPKPGGGFRAISSGPLPLETEGKTRESARNKLKDLIQKRLEAGVQIETIEVAESDPWLRYAGDLKDDPLYDEWQDEIKRYRAKRDAEDSAE